MKKIKDLLALLSALEHMTLRTTELVGAKSLLEKKIAALITKETE